MAATDTHEFASGGLNGPFQNAAAVSPHDDNDLTNVSAAIQVGGNAGNIVMITQGGSTVTLAFAAGQIMPIRATRIKATSTTATGIVTLW